MPPAVYEQQIKKLVRFRHALCDAAGVESFRLELDADARICGRAYLPDRDDATDFDDVLVEHDATLDAPPGHTHIGDGGELTDGAVSIHFSEAEMWEGSRS